ncbi:unnamed protein product [Phytomonas sp. EM1]|nr:unnamed protein product [Phytomonas sp. EM1]|eukprot:CCW65018.1 unnamed protein product [Phytomonas sp. isolate EM1]
MPNPYLNNDKAARFVDYYASADMLKESVNRLYYGGIAWKKATEDQAEQMAYPPEPVVFRTQAEIDAYLQQRVYHEQLRRQQRRTALQRELYPEPRVHGRVLSEKELQQHIKHVYNDPIRRQKLRQREIERIFGTERKLNTVARTPEDEKVLKALEASWRPPSASPSHRDDNRCLLVSQYEYYANPTKVSELNLHQRRLPKSTDRERHLQRLADLAKPHSITPRRNNEKESNRGPAFHVHRKIDYKD